MHCLRDWVSDSWLLTQNCFVNSPFETVTPDTLVSFDASHFGELAHSNFRKRSIKVCQVFRGERVDVRS